MSNDDWQALKELENDESNVIKEADKAVVIMNIVSEWFTNNLKIKTHIKVDPSCNNKTMRAMR